MPYASGGRSARAALTGRPTPTATPEAEMWMGAHQAAPARVVRGGKSLSLADAIAHAPEKELGVRCVKELGPRLPFLLKVLAAAEPLSIQAHPSSPLARA